MSNKLKIYQPALFALLFSIMVFKSFGQAVTTNASDSTSDQKLEKLKKDVEADPNNQEKIKAYLEVAAKDPDKLPLQFDKWKRMFPSSSIIQMLAQRMPLPANQNVMDSMRLAVEADPDNLELHEAYIQTIRFNREQELISQYDVWMKKFPKSAVVPYVLGNAYIDEESPKAKPYLLKAVAIDPKYAKAWYDLWMDAQRWGDFRQGEEYLSKAVAADPTNTDYAFSYATSFLGLDQDKFTALSLKVAKQFPHTDRGAQALGYLAANSAKKTDKLQYFKLMQDNFSPAQCGGYMFYYYDVLLSVDPMQAASIAQEMKDVVNGGGVDWTDLAAQAQLFARGKEMLDQHKTGYALSVFNEIKLPKYCENGNESLFALKAEAIDQEGQHEAAYDSIMNAFVKEPSPMLRKALYRYGLKLGKTEVGINTDIYKSLDAKAEPAAPFTLKKYIGEGDASLSDYKGKVILLTYWFPGCGPCRAELPFFENVVKQYNTKPLAYLGINIVRSQDDYVLSFHKYSGFSFTPLADVDGRVKGNLDNKGQAPANFLIDQNGRIIFSGFRIHAGNEADLKLMIDLLLNAPDSFTKNK